MAKLWWHRSKSHTALFSALTAIILITLSFVFVYIERSLEPKPFPPVALPERLVIPIINVNAQIQIVGTDSFGRMEMPSNYTDVAWYKSGARPGERGNAVIDGHLDTATTSDAVFAMLSLLKPDDDIYGWDKAGQKIHFRVTAKEMYEETKSPLEKIFGQTDKAKLNLITCDGVWDPKTKNYSKRLVVYSIRVL